MVASVPSCVRLLSITTGVGHSSMMTASAFRPSITGMLTSIVNRSGRSFFVSSMASLPFFAVPATVKSGWPVKRSLRTLRIKAESSAIKTLIILFTSSSAPRPSML